jgi:hypothetical protein
MPRRVTSSATLLFLVPGSARKSSALGEMKFLRRQDPHAFAMSLPAAFPEYMDAGRTHPTPFGSSIQNNQR